MRRAVLLVLLIGMVVSMAGCDDDKCTTCTESSKQALAVGNCFLSTGSLSFSSFIFATDGGAPVKIDSVTVAGERGYVYYYADYRYYGINYGGALGLASGDTLVITYFTPAGNSIGRVSLLDASSDRPANLNHPHSPPYDMVGLGDPIVVSWDDVPNADWYEIYNIYAFDSSGTPVQRHDVTVVTSPSFTVPGTTTQFNGLYYFAVMAGCGPNPEGTSGNITGGVIQGMITSRISEDLYITVGSGVITVPPLDVPDEQEILLNMIERMR